MTPRRVASRKAGLLLLVDAGATWTRAVVASPKGALLGQGHAGPANAFAVGDRLALANLLGATHQALTSAKIAGQAVAAAIVGSASVDHDGSGGAPIEAALRRCLPSPHLHAVADSLIALEGALLGAAGVVVLSGTGSVILGKSPGERIVKVGGWGPLLGDEGSAQWVGRQALQAAARATDGIATPTSLTRTLQRHFCLPSFHRIIDVVYKRPLSPADLGALAPLVARAARRGDGVARDIFRCAGRALARQAAQAVCRLELKQPRVSYQGSLFRVGRILLDPLRAALRSEAPQAALVAPALPPLGGAFLLALASLGQAPAAPVIARFRRNCRV